MSFKELREAADHVMEGRAKLGEVIYGDDGLDMAIDISAVVDLVRDLAKCEVEGRDAYGVVDCSLCGMRTREPPRAEHRPDCPWRRAVECIKAA